MKPQTGFIVFQNGARVDIVPSWYPQGVLDFTLAADSLDVVKVIAVEDTTLTGIDPEGRPPAPLAVRFYPNPFRGELTLETAVAGELEIFDVAGRSVGGCRLAGAGRHRMTLTFPAGVYFWRLGAHSGKLVRLPGDR